MHGGAQASVHGGLYVMSFWFGLLNIVGWNVRGIGKRVLGDFFKDLSTDVDWDIIMCQEFGVYTDSTVLVGDGHQSSQRNILAICSDFTLA